MQQAPSTRLTLQPFQINLNSLQEKKAKYQKLCLIKCCCRCNDWEKANSWTCLNFKHIKEEWDTIRIRHINGRSAPCQTTHCIKMINIALKSLDFGMKFHIWIAKWFLSTQIRPISYYWTDSLVYVLCPRTFRTTHVHILVHPHLDKHVKNY